MLLRPPFNGRTNLLSFLAALVLASCFQSAFSFRDAAHWKQDRADLLAKDGKIYKEHVFLVAVVTSPASWRERRGWLRDQWDKNMRLLNEHVRERQNGPSRIIFKFAIGVENEDSEEFKGILEEQKEFGDILLLYNVQDLEVDYAHLHPHWPWYNTSATTEKVLYSMQWAVTHYDFEYFARIGDDAYFRPDEFYKQARNGEFPSKLAVIGLMTGPLPYTVAGKEAQVVYPSGAGYIVTHDVAIWVSKSATMWNVGFPEDANFGAWLSGTKITFVDAGDRMHDWDFGPHYRSCSPRDILVHHMRTKADWERIDSKGEITC